MVLALTDGYHKLRGTGKLAWMEVTLCGVLSWQKSGTEVPVSTCYLLISCRIYSLTLKIEAICYSETFVDF
jgi:hypothetical protein